MAKILTIVTGHSEIDTRHPTGLWYDEFAVPYAAFREQNFEVVTASPRGGRAPLDPRSLEGVDPDQTAMRALENTVTLQQAGDAYQYDAVFIPGGHGTMFDLAKSQPLKALVSELDAQGKIVAAVCHGPAAFVDAIRAAEPRTLVAGRRITCFTDAEERATKLDSLMPFLLASKLREQGAQVVERSDWEDHVEIDANWITGQNPQSSGSTARAVIEALRARV
ncbi:MAG TPA: type 1 glutamine amidotransferase domain-containing protein [Candidatus Baltobacteraceae bacterium]|jgi:putative intracellular protease/amidase|nr:type 1 glutamine amidotransferase domain-containing protein [Candidatus Baltobacteraceae bacterium]